MLIITSLLIFLLYNNKSNTVLRTKDTLSYIGNKLHYTNLYMKTKLLAHAT